MEPEIKPKRIKIDPKSIDQQENCLMTSLMIPTLESLPNDIFNLISAYLSTCDKMALRMVCTRLQYIMNDPYHWKCVTIPPYVCCKSPTYVESVLKLSESHVKSLSLVGYTPPTISFLSSCTAVTALDLHGSDISTTSMKELLLALPNISRLSINIDMKWEQLLPMLSSLQQLVIYTHKYIFGCNHYEDDQLMIRKFLNNWKQCGHKPLNIAIKCGVPYIHDTSSQNVGLLSFYDGHFDYLNTDLHYTPNCCDPNPKIIQVIGTSEHNVEISICRAISLSVLSSDILYTHADVYISPAWCGRPLSSAVIIEENMKMMNITSLYISSTHEIPYDIFRNILSCTPNLLTIGWGCSSERLVRRYKESSVFVGYLKASSMSCPQLTSLYSVCERSEFTHDIIDEVWSSILSFKYLEHLSICSCLFLGVAPSYYRHEQVDLSHYIKSLPVSFKSLHIHIEDYGRGYDMLDTVSKNIGHIHNLQVLHIFIIRREFRDLNLQPILEGCTKLEELVCSSRSDHLRIFSSTNINRLKCLMLEVSYLTDSFMMDLVPIGEQNRNLQMLYVKMFYVDDAAETSTINQVTRVLDHCPNLVSYYVNVSTRHGRSEFVKEHRPRLLEECQFLAA